MAPHDDSRTPEMTAELHGTPRLQPPLVSFIASLDRLARTRPRVFVLNLLWPAVARRHTR
jgi:hypothetical protein